MQHQANFYNIVFQEGAVKEVGINGCQTPDIINVLIKELTLLNVAPHATRETSMAITKLDEAAMWLDKRIKDREARGVEGTQKV